MKVGPVSEETFLGSVLGVVYPLLYRMHPEVKIRVTRHMREIFDRELQLAEFELSQGEQSEPSRGA